jgi:methanogenic corrinoid protein MtbC1
LGPFLEALHANDVVLLRQSMAATSLRMGLGRFVFELLAPLNIEIGKAWLEGRLEVFQEHLYTESVQVVLRNALHQLSVADMGRPRVLLSTVSGEPHGLGLLMAEAVLALEGCHCISLGVQTPVWDIVRAAAATEAEIVALSCTGCTGPNHVMGGLMELRAKLPPGVAIWVGGNAPVLQRRVIEGVHVVPLLDQLPDVLAAWRAAHPS